MFYTAFSDDNLISNVPVIGFIALIAILGVAVEGRRARFRAGTTPMHVKA
jgi:hypothetical protein